MQRTGETGMTVADHIQNEHGIVGRRAELDLALAVLSSGRHLLLEGPVGVGKTTVALAVCDHLERTIIRIDGDERYTENKLTGWFDPPLVLKAGYGEQSFFPGPLVRAMREGAILFINELNRMPESVQNVLLPALDEGLLILPRIGEVRTATGFQVVATQNPVEYIATGHLSEALKDRFEHIPLLLPVGGGGAGDRAPRIGKPRRGAGGRRGAHRAHDARQPPVPQGRLRARRGEHRVPSRSSLTGANGAARSRPHGLADAGGASRRGGSADLASAIDEILEAIKKN